MGARNGFLELFARFSGSADLYAFYDKEKLLENFPRADARGKGVK